MNRDQAETIALHRWGVIAEAANAALTKAQRGAVVRAIAMRTHAHPDGSERVYARNTIDRWVRDWRGGGLEALRPSPRADVGTVRVAARRAWLGHGRGNFPAAAQRRRSASAATTIAPLGEP